MTTIISNILLRKLASFPNEAEAIAYARQKLAEGVAGVNIVASRTGYEVNRPVHFLF